MKQVTWIALFLAPALPACGGSSDGPTAEGTGGASSTTSAAAGPTTTGDGSTGAGGGDDGSTITLTMSTFVVPTGAEVYKCQNYANPFGGKDVHVSEFESHMALGSHHMILFYKTPNAGAPPIADGPIEDCSGLEFAATPYSTQLPDDSLAYPAGVAGLIPGNTGMRIQSHYLNTTPADVTAKVTVTFHLAKEGTVTANAGVLFVVEPNIDIAANSTGIVKHDCALPYDMNLIKASSHMHKHGTDFVSTIAGKTIFDTTAWSDPKPALFEPAKLVHGGDPLHFECTFVNNGATPLTFGESAQTNEMCIFVSAYYPIPAGGDVTVGCQ